MTLGPYASFIVTSYLLVTMVVLMLIAWIGESERRFSYTRVATLVKAADGVTHAG